MKGGRRSNGCQACCRQTGGVTCLIAAIIRVSEGGSSARHASPVSPGGVYMCADPDRQQHLELHDWKGCRVAAAGPSRRRALWCAHLRGTRLVGPCTTRDLATAAVASAGGNRGPQCLRLEGLFWMVVSICGSDGRDIAVICRCCARVSGGLRKRKIRRAPGPEL